MSAFVVDDSTIDRIVSFLGHHDHDYLARIFQPLGYDPAGDPEWTAFQERLMELEPLTAKDIKLHRGVASRKGTR